MGAAIAVPAIVSGLGAGAGLAAASNQNRAIRRSAAAQQESARAQNRQLTEAAALERQRIQNRAKQVEGRLRVLTIAAGGSGGDTFADLERQAQIDEALNLSILHTNEANQRASLNAGLQANIANLGGQVQNALLTGLLGGLQGLNSGLAINQGFGIGDGSKT